MPEISVIIPVYNTGRYLARCFDSLLAQTFTDFEVVVVDDGSTDDSLEICRGYAQRDQRFVILHQANAGVSAARNLGLDQARGRWISFVDSDDSVDPDYLEQLYAASNDCDMVVCGFRDVSPSGVIEHRLPDGRLSGKEILSYLGRPEWGYVWGRLVRASLLRDCGIRFDTQVTFREDNILVMDILANVATIGSISYIGYNYFTGITVQSARTKPYDKELYAFNRAVTSARALSNSLGTVAVYRYINLFGFFYHVVSAVYREGYDRSGRLSALRGLEFSRSMLFPYASSTKEWLLYKLIVYRLWRVFDFLYLKCIS